MRSRDKQTLVTALRWDFAAVILLAIGVFAYSWLSETRVRSTESTVTDGSRPPDRAEGDVLLLLPDTPSAEAKNFDELDCSYAWFNTLWQEYGSFATALRRDLSPEILAGRTAVVVPARVAQDMPGNGVAALKRFVEQGGQLLVERPTDVWASLASVQSGGKERHAQKITSVEGLQLHGVIRDQLLEVPLSGPLTPAPPTDTFPDGPTLLEIDGQPGVMAEQIGEGWVYTFLYNHGCVSLALQQGRPIQDTMRFSTSRAANRAFNPKAGANTTPNADILDRALLRRLATVRPTARFWYFPGTHSGAMVLTISASDDMGSALTFADQARQRDGLSTIYAAADRIDETQAALAQKSNAEIGLSWVRGVTRELVTESVGIGGLRPIANELTLNAQFTRLNLTLPESEPLRLGRIEASEMAPGWSTAFQQLAAARIRMSSTLGPSGPDQWGYIFGTGFPFYPIDARGLPLPLLESPFVLRGSGISRKRLEALLSASEGGLYQPLVINLPSDVMRLEPSAGVLLGFRDMFDLARSHDHWIAQHGEFLDFLSARRRSVMTSQFKRSTRRLTVSTNTLGSRSKSLEKGAFPSVAVPRSFQGQPVEAVEIDDKERSIKRLAIRGEELVIETGQGRHVIVVTYREPQPIRIKQTDGH